MLIAVVVTELIFIIVQQNRYNDLRSELDTLYFKECKDALGELADYALTGDMKYYYALAEKISAMAELALVSKTNAVSEKISAMYNDLSFCSYQLYGNTENIAGDLSGLEEALQSLITFHDYDLHWMKLRQFAAGISSGVI